MLGKNRSRDRHHAGKRARNEQSQQRKSRSRADGMRASGHAANQGAADVRLQKVLAAAGIGSRRYCETLIVEGRVDVDGQTITELGTRVDPERQKIRVDSEMVRPPKRKLYFLVNKPLGILSTNHDPAGRPRVIDLAPSHQRLFTVGRLDKSSSGLILVTNDGALTDLLTHPRYGVEKTYLAQVVGVPKPEALAKLERGVHLAEGFAHAERVTVRHSHRHSTILEIVLAEGRNREVRRLLARLGHKVLTLRRIAMGPLRLGKMQPGESRPLRRDEIELLYQTARTRRQKSSRRSNRESGEIKSAAPGGQRSKDRAERTSSDEPIIDYSLPAELVDDEAALDFDLAAAENIASQDIDAVKETATVDLSPMTRGSRRSQPQRTVIGAERNRGEQMRGNKKRGRSTGQQVSRGQRQKRRGRRHKD